MAKKSPSRRQNHAKAAPSRTPPVKTTGPSVYTIPSYQSFLDVVARGMLDQVQDNPLLLADYKILVPDRDIAAALRQAFIEQLQGKTHIMPHIGTPGDMDDEQLSLRISDNALLSQALMDIPPAVSPLQRQLMLAQEILKIPGMSSSPQKAIKLGGELGKFLDEVQRHNVELRDIEYLVPAVFKDQWSKTAEFLKIITETWPEKLEEMGRIDPEDHKNIVIQIQAEHWQQNKPKNPVFAVGFNDGTPAIQSLLQAVAKMPQGTLIMQGIDLGMDEQSWGQITPVHPQYIMKETLKGLNINRAAIREWEAQPLAVNDFVRAPNPARTNQSRQKLLSKVMRQTSNATEENAEKEKIDVQALNGMDLITCGTQQEEASVIALKMRESLEVPGRKATLVTADRSLARRVSARLRNWDITVQDAAGTPLSDTSAGIYLLSTAAMAAEEWAPVQLLEALKHPLATMGERKSSFRRKLSDLENMVFHGPRPVAGANGVKSALSAAFNRAARRPQPTQTPEMLAAEQQALDTLVDNIQAAGQKFFEKMSSKKPVPFQEILDEHIRFAEALARDDKESGAQRIWRNDDGVKAARFLTNLREVAHLVPSVTGQDYVSVLQTLMHDITIHSSATSHPTLKIMTPAQAQLLKSDIVIVGGLNDGVWPQKPNENPWLSPAMIEALGLPSPEIDIGREAYNFIQMASNPNVLLTRALRSSDAPSVSSPFLTKLMAVLRSAGLEEAIEKKTHLLDIHKAMYTPAQVTPIEPPHVTPPVDKRPSQLPVTAVEMLMRDPYAVYVKYVLKLRPKDPLDTSPGVAERGIFTHAALDAFVKKYPGTLPDNAEEELLKIGRNTFKERINNPTVRAFWWPRFERIAKWFVKFEQERRTASKILGTEVHGKLEIDTGDGIFTLTAIADRLDRDENDQVTIIDYKTGGVPSQKSVALGFSPQMTLEALIAFTGGFDGIDAADVGKLQYWKLSGGRPAAQVTDVKGDIKDLVDEARQGVTSLIKTFNDKNVPYLANPRPDWSPRYSQAQHLSRIDEWSTVKKTSAKKTTRRQTPSGKGRSKR